MQRYLQKFYLLEPRVIKLPLFLPNIEYSLQVLPDGCDESTFPATMLLNEEFLP